MQPERWLVFHLHDQRAADDDGAGQHDDEDRRPVTGIDEGEIQPAGLAARPQGEEAAIELAAAAARAFAGKPAQRALGHRGQRRVLHASGSFAWRENKRGGPVAAPCSTMVLDQCAPWAMVSAPWPQT